MRTVQFDIPARQSGTPRLARLTRHWNARLEDFGPGGPQVLAADQERGEVLDRFPGHETKAVLNGLRDMGVSARREGDNARFFLRPDIRCEELDYAGGCLFELL